MLRIKKYHFDFHNQFHASILTMINGDHAIYRNPGKKQEWMGLLYAQPGIFQPETDMEVTALASHEVAKKASNPAIG